jgi:type III pantothenate kinase
MPCPYGMPCGIIDRVKSRLLAIAIGNSNVKVGVFQGVDLLAHWRAHTEVNQTADEYALLLGDFFSQAQLEPDGWCGAVLVSVVPPLTTTFQELCRQHLRLDPLVVGAGVKTGMPIRYDNPRALGADRLVAAVGAKARFDVPVIVVDFGTAITFNVVNRAGQFVGGAIAPGLNLAADALYEATAQLPRIDLAVPPSAIATNTIHAIQSGILIGYLGLVERMVRDIRAELKEPQARVVATGGLASLVASQSRVIDVIEPNLVLYGLSVIYEINHGTGASSQ